MTSFYLYASFAELDFGTVAASRYNEHDFVAKIAYDGERITSFEEIVA